MHWGSCVRSVALSAYTGPGASSLNCLLMKSSLSGLLALALGAGPAFANGARSLARPLGPGVAAPALSAGLPGSPALFGSADLALGAGAGELALPLPAFSVPMAEAAVRSFPAASAPAVRAALKEETPEPAAAAFTALPAPAERPAPAKGQEAEPDSARGQLALAAASPEAAGVRFDGGGAPASPAPVETGPDAYDALSLERAADEGMREPPDEDDEPPAPESQRPGQRFWEVVRFGITLAVLAPVLYRAAPPAMLFYAVPAALALSWGVRVAVALVREFYWRGLIESANRGLPAAERIPLPAQSSYLGRFLRWSRGPEAAAWGGAAVGVAIAFAILASHGTLPIATALYAAATVFAARAAGRLAGRALKVATLAWRRFAPTRARSAARAAAARVRPFLDRLRRLAGRRWKTFLFGTGLALAGAVAAPLAHEVFSITSVLYVGLLALGGALALDAAAEVLRLVKGLQKLIREGGWRRGWPARLAYAGALTLGLALGHAPARHVGPVVEHGFRLGAEASRRLIRNETLMRSLPAAWQDGLLAAADAGHVHMIRGGAFEEETIKELSKTPRGRALLDDLRDAGGTVRLPKFYLIDQSRSGAFENPLVHGVFLSPAYVEARGWDVHDFLQDPEKQRRLAREHWQLAYHELYHAKQSFRLSFSWGMPVLYPGQLNHFPRQLTSFPHLELEYEAHIEDNLALLERLESEPDAPGDDWHLEKFAGGIDLFLADIDGAAAYRSFVRVDSRFYREYIADVRARWPRLSVRIYEVLAVRHRNDPARAMLYRQMALIRAQQHGLLP